MADRAFAYDGSFRTPDAMSAANRAAYGLHRGCANEASRSFRAALQRASTGASAILNLKVIARGNANARHTRSPNLAGPASDGMPQRDADLAERSTRPPIRARDSTQSTSAPYVLFVSAAGCIIRAIVWRGRVFCGGIRTCPKSIR